MIAFSLDNLLFVLLITVAVLFRLLSKAVTQIGKKQPDKTPTSQTPQRPPPIRRAPAESDADRIRKFLEALGQPPTSNPPPPVAPRTDIPPRRVAPVQPPPVIPGAWRLPREQRQKPDVTQKESPRPEQPSHFETTVSRPVLAPAAPTFEVHDALTAELQQPPIIKTPGESYQAPKAFGAAKRSDLKTDLATLLTSKSGLREAILLCEVFGQPRGLREFELP